MTGYIALHGALTLISAYFAYVAHTETSRWMNVVASAFNAAALATHIF